MPEGLSAGQAVHSSTLKEADASAAQEPHFQTLEQALSFFEKQDPEGFFGAPVTEDVAPNYFNVIKHPMSFQRMRQKLRALEYRTFAAFVEDFELVGNNAMRYNQKRSRVHRSAVNLLRHGKKHLNTVQLEATRAIHMLHPEGPVAAAQEEAAVSRAANAVALSTSTSNPNKLLPSLSMPHHSSKQLQRGVSGLDMSVPMALQDLQADYFSEEDPAYSSFSDTDLDDSDTEQKAVPFLLDIQHRPVVAEPWGSASRPEASTSAPADSSTSQQPASGTQWQTHWLELRIHSLKQQQQHYEAKLLRLQQQAHQRSESSPPPVPPDPHPAFASVPDASHQPDATSSAQISSAPAYCTGMSHAAAAAAEGAAPPPVEVQQSLLHTAESRSQPSAQSLLPADAAAGPNPTSSLAQPLQQQAAAAHEPRCKHRHSRQQMPGLSMPEMARHPFFCQFSSAEARSDFQQPVLEEGAKDDCYPARVHATLDLLDRHLATMKDQLTPKPPPGRVPPKKVARGGVAVARRGKAKPGRARGLFAPPSKQALERNDSKLGKRRRTADYDFGDVIMPPLPGAKALAQLPKVCITVPGVRPLPEEELGRRMRAVEHIRSGTSVSEADSDLGELLSAAAGVAVLADVRANSSSDEDISDEAFAARHAVLEAEEQQRFNSFAGGGAQRSARTVAAGSKPKLPKPAVRMDSMPPPEAKLLNVAAAVIPPPSPVVAMDPAAVLGALTNPEPAPAAQAAALTSPAAAGQVQQQQQQSTVAETADTAQVERDGTLHERLMSNGEEACDVVKVQDHEDGKNINALPQLGLALAPNHVDGVRPVSCAHSKGGTRNGRKSSTPRGDTPRAGMGRPPRGGSGNMPRQDTNADRKDNRKLTRRNTTG